MNNEKKWKSTLRCINVDTETYDNIEEIRRTLGLRRIKDTVEQVVTDYKNKIIINETKIS